MAPQFSKEERNFLLFEYLKRRGGMDFLPGLIHDFQAQFPGTRPPAPKTIRAICKKQVEKGTVLNCNSANSPGDTHSGRTSTTSLLLTLSSAQPPATSSNCTFYSLKMLLMTILASILVTLSATMGTSNSSCGMSWTLCPMSEVYQC